MSLLSFPLPTSSHHSSTSIVLVSQRPEKLPLHIHHLYMYLYKHQGGASLGFYMSCYSIHTDGVQKCYCSKFTVIVIHKPFVSWYLHVQEAADMSLLKFPQWMIPIFQGTNSAQLQY